MVQPFGGNPMACAVGGRAFDIINAPETLAHVDQQGQKLQTALRELGEKTGIFKKSAAWACCSAVCWRTNTRQGFRNHRRRFKTRLMVLVAGANVVRFAPSLLLNDEDMVEG